MSSEIKELTKHINYQLSTMHATIALLPLLAFAMGIAAAPAPLHPVARAVPDINEVARNPAPIDHHVGWDDHGKPTLGDISHLSPEDIKKLKDLIKHLLGGSHSA
ncbi:hypothetical protein J4E93_009299 [Alternaria ventricosa]|uniref:uncharacterized protein n=1 Tax=Alternaria ventricosa TaxID=1187951 RepID=UPI0020C489C3|nr:uncharacterized protein J4E93_009299 [Alternaria ventricosa]KAI4639470.1 hypothetical protein J4E93_009299 [Alternaria ventricosa]